MCGLCTEAKTPPEPDKCPPVFGSQLSLYYPEEDDISKNTEDQDKSAAAGIIVQQTQTMLTSHQASLILLTVLLSLSFGQ